MTNTQEHTLEILTNKLASVGKGNFVSWAELSRVAGIDVRTGAGNQALCKAREILRQIPGLHLSFITRRGKGMIVCDDADFLADKSNERAIARRARRLRLGIKGVEPTQLDEGDNELLMSKVVIASIMHTFSGDSKLPGLSKLDVLKAIKGGKDPKQE